MTQKSVLSVSELTYQIKSLIETSIPSVIVEGEVSNWKPSSSGHVYFTLKDKNASIQAVIWRSKASKLDFVPRDGLLVRASGSIDVYAPRGQYQIIVNKLEKAGTGDILLMLEERKQRLLAEGLFSESRKRNLPAFPSRVVIITSQTGAALHDILSVMNRRNSGIRLTILPAVVQGDEAANSLVKKLEIANRYKLGDVIIIGRGGGSIEDLLAFSDEALVRAVASSKIPVISAVGHEVDWSLCDFAADCRAPTPSAAAEIVSQNAENIADRIYSATETTKLAFKSKLQTTKRLLESFSKDKLSLQFKHIIEPRIQRLDNARENTIYGMKDVIKSYKHSLASYKNLIIAANPEEILKRGFAIVKNKNTNKIILNAKELKNECIVNITLKKGNVDAKISVINNSAKKENKI